MEPFNEPASDNKIRFTLSQRLKSKSPIFEAKLEDSESPDKHYNIYLAHMGKAAQYPGGRPNILFVVDHASKKSPSGRPIRHFGLTLVAGKASYSYAAAAENNSASLPEEEKIRMRAMVGQLVGRFEFVPSKPSEGKLFRNLVRRIRAEFETHEESRH